MCHFKISLFSSVFILLILICSCRPQDGIRNTQSRKVSIKSVISRQEVPRLSNIKSDTLLVYKGFVAYYNRKTKNPDRVAYELTAKEASSKMVSREGNDYCPNPFFKGPQADDADYKRSGW